MVALNYLLKTFSKIDSWIYKLIQYILMFMYKYIFWNIHTYAKPDNNVYFTCFSESFSLHYMLTNTYDGQIWAYAQFTNISTYIFINYEIENKGSDVW